MTSYKFIVGVLMTVAVVLLPFMTHAQVSQEMQKMESAVQTKEGAVLTMEEAVSKALILNPELNKMKAQLDAKSLEWKASLGLYTPEFGFAREGISAIEPTPFQEQRFTFQQEVDFPLTTFYRLKKIGYENEALAKTFEALKKEVIAGVKSRYEEVLFAASIRELRQTSHDLLKDMLEVVLARIDSGSSTYTDQLSTEIGLLSAENDQYEAERDYHVARYALFSYIGFDPDQQGYDLQLSDSLTVHNELIQQEIALYQLQKQPSYQSTLLETDAAKLALREAKSTFLPSIRFGYLIQDFGTGYHFNGFETGLRIPLWGMFEQSGNVGMARAGLAQTLWQQKSVEIAINEKIEIAWHSYYNSQVTMDLFNNKIKDKSQKLLDLTTEEYRNGKIDRLKFLEAQQVYLENREKFLRAQYNYYLRLIELEQYMDFELIR
jgi:cobalt-zinc-cadmium efflux system outer membrane protein